ncbi:hypothetical protein ABH925_004667 [Streptacidiphilus sp. EB129]
MPLLTQRPGPAGPAPAPRRGAAFRRAASRRGRAAAGPVCVLLLVALVAALARTVTGGGTLGNSTPLPGWYVVDGVLFAAAVLALRLASPRHGGRRTAALVLAGSVALAVTGLLAPPRTSDDAYRYVWDGQVQSAGISPYAYAPTDPALASLRADDPALFPTTGSCTGWDLHRSGAICTHINRPTVHTIYPPVAEVWFLGVYQAGRLTGGHGVRTAQAGGALLAVATTGALLLLLRRRRAPLHRAALWGWCPGVVLWAVNDAHVDALGALLMVCGLGRVWRGRQAVGGALLGLATATKLIPVLALPGVMAGVLARGRRPVLRDLLVPAVAAGTFLLCYLPYVLASGLGVIGFLPGYLQEEGYDQGSRFALLSLLGLPQQLLGYLVGALLLATVLVVLRRGDPAAPWRGALLVIGTALLLADPHYPWYALLVVALVALDGRVEWLGVPAAGEFVYLFGSGTHGVVEAYGAALYLVLAGAAVRSLGRTAALVSAPAPAAPARPAARPREPSPTVPLPADRGPVASPSRTASSR